MYHCNEWLLIFIDIDNNAIGFDPHQKFLVSIVSIVDSSYSFYMGIFLDNLVTIINQKVKIGKLDN